MRCIDRMSLAAVLLSFGLPLVAQVPTNPKSARPMTYGTSAVSYVEIPAVEFLPRESSTSYSESTWLARYSTNCIGTCFAAPLHLPSGALITYLELNFIDTDSLHNVGGTLLQCDSAVQNCSNHPAAGAGPADCRVSGYICSGNAFNGGEASGSADLTPDAITVDNHTHSLILLAGGNSMSNSTAVGGMIVGYVLQVSPPPVSPTFNDVPTTHPFFQFIEALHASGITGGCQASPPLYCPDSPLTRGQMAVFLAKALGLQWQ